MPQQTTPGPAVRPRPWRAVVFAAAVALAVVAGATPSVAAAGGAAAGAGRAVAGAGEARVTPGAERASSAAGSEPSGSAPGDGGRVRLGGGTAVKGEYLVALEAGQQVGATAQRLRRDHGGRVGQTYEAVLGGFLLRATPTQAQRYAADDRVRSVVPNEVVRATAETEPTGVRRIGADQARRSGSTGAGATVAVLDTGIDLDHSDLVANLSPTLGIDCIDPGTAPEDRHGHGTHVAGIIAAARNGAQVVGVAPGVTLVPVRVLPAQGSGSLSALVCGLDYVTRHADEIDVVNVSLGGAGSAGSCTDGGLHQAVCQTVAAGVTVVVSAGNDKKDATSLVPARYPEVITVSALDDRDGTPAQDRMASFSNHGASVDLTAPGVLIVSTGLGGGLVTLSGTSMASPHVAGVAALALARDPSLTPAGVRSLLQATGECPDRSVAGSDGTCAGKGIWPEDRDGIAEPLVDAARAAGAAPQRSPDATPPPTVGRPPLPPVLPVLPSLTGALTATLTAPAHGETLTGIATVALALDGREEGTVDAAWRLDGGRWQALARSGSGFTAVFATRTVPNGLHTVQGRATDAAGRTTATGVLTVVVENRDRARTVRRIDKRR